MNKSIYLNIIFALLVFNQNAYSQKSEAWKAIQISKYVQNQNLEEDAVVLFDKEYHYFSGLKESVDYEITYHRKIKVSSFYGLDQYNKLYISTYDNDGHKIELTAIQIINLKPDGSRNVIDTSGFVETSLPGNAPFYFKKKGKVKMLAIPGLSINDELEYVYTIKHQFQIAPEYFSFSTYENFTSRNLCLKKSLYFESTDFQIQLSPFNFKNIYTTESDFKHANGQKIEMENVQPFAYEPFSSRSLDQPILYFSVDKKELGSKSTWQDLVYIFTHKSKNNKRAEIYGQTNANALREDLLKLGSILERFKLIHQRINENIEIGFYSYEFIKDDIDIALNYAKSISFLMGKLKMPVNFHFVKDKKTGELDTAQISVNQFTNIIISFDDEFGKQHFFPILEPYSIFDEFNPNFFGTKCLTLKQNEFGEASYIFEKIPDDTLKNTILKNIEITVLEVSQDSIKFRIKKEVTLQGEGWYAIKPNVYHILKHSEDGKELKDYFIKSESVNSGIIDSIFNFEKEASSKSFIFSFEFVMQSQINDLYDYISFRPNLFIQDENEIPFEYRANRKLDGYLFDEPFEKISIKIHTNNLLEWLDNTSFNRSTFNEIGEIETSYLSDSDQLELKYRKGYLMDRFTKDQWPLLVDLNDHQLTFLNTLLYFKRK